MAASAQVRRDAHRSPFPSILSVVGFLAAGLALVTVCAPRCATPSSMQALSWLGWTFVGAIWAIALGLILGTLWQEYQARIQAAYPSAEEDEDDEDDDSSGMPGRYLIH